MIFSYATEYTVIRRRPTYRCSRWVWACRRRLWWASPAVDCVCAAAPPVPPVSAVRCLRQMPTWFQTTMTWRHQHQSSLQAGDVLLSQVDAGRQRNCWMERGTHCRHRHCLPGLPGGSLMWLPGLSEEFLAMWMGGLPGGCPVRWPGGDFHLHLVVQPDLQTRHRHLLSKAPFPLRRFLWDIHLRHASLDISDKLVTCRGEVANLDHETEVSRLTRRFQSRP